MMQWCELASVCKVVAGQSPPSSSYNKAGIGVPFFQGKADFGEMYPTVRYWCDEPQKMSLPNDILFSVRAPVGPVNINNVKACIGRGLAAIRCENGVELKYLFHYLRANEDRIASHGTGSTFKAITVGVLNELQIPLPPLDQQKKIAAILDAADEYRLKTRTLIAKYDELAQSLYLDMFGDLVSNPQGWMMQYLGDICDVGSSNRVFVDELVDDGIPFYRGTEIGHLSTNGAVKPSLFITREHYEKLKAQTGVPKIGDLLLPSICPDGRIWRIPNDQHFYFKDGRVLWIKVDGLNINSLYLKAFLKEIFYRSYAKIASGTTFAELKIFALKKIQVLVPPMNLQNQFAERIQAIEAQKAQAQKSLDKAEELFKSLFQKAFNGGLEKE